MRLPRQRAPRPEVTIAGSTLVVSVDEDEIEVRSVADLPAGADLELKAPGGSEISPSGST